jgi:hypothetical protein
MDSTFILSARGAIPDTLMLAIGRSSRFDSAAVDDLLRRNVPRVRMEARFSAARPFVLLRGPAGEMPESMKDSHLVFISLPGFDPARRKSRGDDRDGLPGPVRAWPRLRAGARAGRRVEDRADGGYLGFLIVRTAPSLLAASRATGTAFPCSSTAS